MVSSSRRRVSPTSVRKAEIIGTATANLLSSQRLAIQDADAGRIATRTAFWSRAIVPVLLVVVTFALGWRLAVSPQQFAINDFGPIGASMLQTCLLSYDSTGVGRENLHTIPGYCDYGTLSMLLGGNNAQHLLFLTLLAVAGISMYCLLGRIGNPPALSIMGAVAYEFSPVMLSYQLSGEGLLVTAALLPAVLIGAVHKPGYRPIIEGARSGAVLALICYANPQAPSLAVFLLVPAIAVMLVTRPTGTRNALILCATFGVVFLIAAIPVLMIVPGFGTFIQAMRGELQGDFVTRLAANSIQDFFTPYVVVGVIPALIALVVIASGLPGMQVAERAAAISFVSIPSLWEVLQHFGSAIGRVFPLVTMFKDFIKLEITLAVPLVILSVGAIRWAFTATVPWKTALRYGPVVPIGALLLLPLGLGTPLAPVYATNYAGPYNGQALASGQFGLPPWAMVPRTYTDVLASLRRTDPDTASYRVLWIPIDWRLMQMSRASDVNLLLYRSENSAQSQLAITQAFSAIVNDQEPLIAPLLADLGVKYVVLDLADGQDQNAQPWQRGPRILASVWDSEVLAGRPEDYLTVLSRSPGLTLTQPVGGWVIYRNSEWRPILKSYTAILTLPPRAQNAVDGAPSRNGPPLSLNWQGFGGVRWNVEPNGSIRIQAFGAQAGQTPWAPVHAFIPVVGGASYLITGSMNYQQVVQAHAKIIWNDLAKDATYLATGHDGTGVVSVAQAIVAPAGATTAEILLMGGWSQGGTSFTQYSDFSVRPMVLPNLETLGNNPDQQSSLWRQLPDVLIEAGVLSLPLTLSGVASLTLSDMSDVGAPRQNQIELLTAVDLKQTGTWIVNAIPDAFGIEHLVGRGPGDLVVPAPLLKSATNGSKITWIEYKPDETDPNNGVIHTTVGSDTGATIRCAVADCTIANVLLVPGTHTGELIARFGSAYSPLLRTPDGNRSPSRSLQDWASLYSPPPRGYPSALYDNSTVIRGAGLLVGHLALLIGLLLGLPRRRQ